MTRFAEGRFLLRVAYYLAILLAILAVASVRMGITPSFVYQGF